MGRYHRRRSHHKKRSLFYGFNRFIRKNPVVSSVIGILSSIVLIRISFLDELFGNNITEFRVWFIFLAVILGIVGVISLMIWIRNNVSDFNFKGDLRIRK